MGELTVEEKINEITVVTELLNLIDIERAIITADAMSCRKKLSKKLLREKQIII